MKTKILIFCKTTTTTKLISVFLSPLLGVGFGPPSEQGLHLGMTVPQKAAFTSIHPALYGSIVCMLNTAPDHRLSPKKDYYLFDRAKQSSTAAECRAPRHRPLRLSWEILDCRSECCYVISGVQVKSTTPPAVEQHHNLSDSTQRGGGF